MKLPIIPAILLATLVPLAMPAQQPAERRCLLEVLNVDREGVRSDFQSNVNYFAGGNVRLRCRGQNVRLGGDSLESYNAQVIRLITDASYRDDDLDINADTIVYTRSDERLQLRGNAVVVNRSNGSKLEGPWIDYLRAVKGVRDSAEVVALENPTIEYEVTAEPGDTVPPSPYIIHGEGMRSRGSSWMVSWGGVRIDRDSLHGRGDSLLLVRAESDMATLVGKPATLTRSGVDSFVVIGAHVPLRFKGRELEGVNAYGDASVRGKVATINADSIELDFAKRQLVATRAWGKTDRARIRADQGYEILGDSVAIDTPDEHLREVRAFGRAVLMEPLDSVAALPIVADSIAADSAAADSTPPIRNTMTGAHLVARFAQHDSAGTTITRVVDIIATGAATSLFSRTVFRNGRASPTINYTRGDTIIVTMKTGDSTGVKEVRAIAGNQQVDGVQLERESLERSIRKSRGTPPVGGPR